jgi:hypothetical protein
VIADTDQVLAKFATAAQRGDAEAVLAEHATEVGVSDGLCKRRFSDAGLMPAVRRPR